MARHVTILLISDDSEIQHVLHQALSMHGFHLQETRKGSQGLVKTLSSEPDLILVDLDQSNGDGIDVIRQIRDQTHTPIVALCRRDDERTTVAALDGGADDYVTKPVHVPGLVAHLRAILQPVPRACLQLQRLLDTRRMLSEYVRRVKG